MSVQVPVKVQVSEVPVFWWDGSMCKKKLNRLDTIKAFFDSERLKTVLLPIIAKEGDLSLRAIDWLVTNYAKKNPIIYKVTPPDCPEVLVNIYRSYKSWLWNYKRKNFDPFRRGNRIFFTRGENDTVVYESTVGQLNFFYWAARYGVLDYAQSHIKAIEKDQAVTTKTTKGEIKGDIRSESKRKKRENDGLGPRTEPAPKKKRRQLSRAPNQSVFVYPTFINVVFNPKSD